MANTCPSCSRLNPASALYCHYDGRNLRGSAQTGALNVASQTFAMPFCFADGRSCANFNQLALACDERWDEAKELLKDGAWTSFFTALGRLDVSAVAKQAAQEADLDLGLSRLLEKFPVDSQTLRPPKLAVPIKEEDLGTLTPGTNRKFELMISNQGMLVLRGMVFTDCDWLVLGSPTGTNQKIFQTRGVYSIPVHVIGSKLRAGLKPLVGEIVVDTNGGAITIPVKAIVNAKAFPKGKYANDSLAGARTPRELAVKAKEAPADAGILFEQGAVKAWYAENGWTYPVEGTIGSGKAAVQQFFEALGLTKPPAVELGTQSITVSGAPGERISKQIKLSTKETKPVYAQGSSNQDWVTVGPVKLKGTSVLLPIEITVPSKAGQRAEASIHIHSNGRKQFMVPISCTVNEPIVEEEEVAPGNPFLWMMAGMLVLLMMVGVGVGVWWVVHPKAPPGDLPVVATDKKPEEGPAILPVVAPAKGGPWWANAPANRVTNYVEDLKRLAPQDAATFDALAAAEGEPRQAAYRQVLKRAPVLLRDTRSKEKLTLLLAECYAFDPSEASVAPIREWLAAQVPVEKAAFQAADKNESVERMFWAVRTAVECFAHEAIRSNAVKFAPTDERVNLLAQSLGGSLGMPMDPTGDSIEMKIQSEKQLSLRLYRNTMATAEKSLDDAFWLRDALIARAPEYLAPSFRQNVDVSLMFVALAAGEDAWPKAEPLVRNTVASPDVASRLRLVEFYANSKPPLSTKLETVLATKWREAADQALDQKTKAEAIREMLYGNTSTAAVKKGLAPAVRQKKLDKLAETALTSAKSPTTQKLAVLQDTVRLAHANAMAAILHQKEPDGKRFDQFISKVPEIDQSDESGGKVEGKKDPKNPAAGGDVITLGQQGKTIQGVLDVKCERDTSRIGSFRKVYRVSMTRGQVYTISLNTNAFDAYLRLENPNGQELASDDDGGGGRNSRLIISASADGIYRVVATSLNQGGQGPYVLGLQLGAGGPGMGFGFGGFPSPLFGNPFLRRKMMPFGPIGPLGPIGPDGMPMQGQPQKEEDPSGINPATLANLDNKQAAVRSGAFLNIAAKVPDDVSVRVGAKIAKYLLVTATKDELVEIGDKMKDFADCRTFLLSLSDQVTRDDVTQKSAETVIGTILGETLKFANNEDFRATCRKMLLERSLDLTEAKRNGADEAADLLRDLYKEQGIAFGMNAEKELATMTRPTQVLAALIKKVAAKAGEQNVPAEDKEFLTQVPRRVQVAQFVAESDIEQMVLLQRLWIRVLAIRLQQTAPEQGEAIEKIQHDLEETDRRLPSAIEQLRSGEEKLLRLWGLAGKTKAA